MLIIGRAVTGWGAGQLTAVFPVYASEMAPPEIRGALGGLQTVCFNTPQRLCLTKLYSS